MATSSALTLDTERTKLVRKYYESNVTDIAHYKYNISEKVYINVSELQAKHGHGYVTTEGIMHKALLKNLLKAKMWAGDISATKFRQLSSELGSNLIHD